MPERFDTSKLGVVAAELMDSLSSEAEEGEELGEVMILAEIKGGDEDGDYSAIHFRCTDHRWWIQQGLLHAALDGEREVLDEDE